MSFNESILRAAEACRKLLPDPFPVDVGLILGSGLGASADRFLREGAQAIRYADIPGMPVTHVSGHAGRLVAGRLGAIRLAMLQGRSHIYEGHDPNAVVFGTQLLAALGMKILIVTNAAGGIRSTFAPGNLMLIEDHIRPLAAKDLSLHQLFRSDASKPEVLNADSRPRAAAIDSARLWNAELRRRALETPTGLIVHSGVYAMMTGPTYETPSEIRMMRHLGADAVGMSTVPEAIAAAEAGVNVLGISCITNVAAGLSDKTLDHHEVTETATAVESQFVDWIWRMVPRL